MDLVFIVETTDLSAVYQHIEGQLKSGYMFTTTIPNTIYCRYMVFVINESESKVLFDIFKNNKISFLCVDKSRVGFELGVETNVEDISILCDSLLKYPEYQLTS